jgi:hypothetical protein
MTAMGGATGHVTSFPSTDAVGAAAVAGAGTCSLGPWAAVDTFALPGGPAAANSLALDGNGDVLAIGGAWDATRHHLVVRKGTQGGTVWSTLDDFIIPSGLYTFGTDIAVFARTGGTARIVVAGGYGDATHEQRLVRESDDGGQTWSTVDEGTTFGSWSNSVAFGGDGTAYTLNDEVPANLDASMIVKSRASSANGWTTADTFTWPLGFGAHGSEIAIDSNGSVFALGYTQGDASGGQSTSMLVRRKLSTSRVFTTVQSGQVATGQSAAASALAEDTLNHALYVVGYETDEQGVQRGLIQRSTAGGAAGTFTSVATYSLSPGQPAELSAVFVDSRHRVHVGGGAVDAAGTWHLIVLTSADGGTTWSQTADYQAVLRWMRPRWTPCSSVS